VVYQDANSRHWRSRVLEPFRIWGCLFFFFFLRDLVGTLEPGNEQAKAHVPGDLGRDRQPQALVCTAEDRDRDPRPLHGTPLYADIMYLECSARLANAA